MHRRKKLKNWLIALTIWFFGAVILWKLWQYQKGLPDPAASYVEFAVMFAATFYLIALIPIKDSVDRVFFGFRELPDPVLES